MASRPSLRTQLRKIWRDHPSAVPFNTPSIVERIALTALILSTEFSFRGVFARFGRFRTIATELYHLVVLVTLGVFSCSTFARSNIAIFVLVYLVYEIVCWSIFDIFVEALDRDLQGTRSALRGLLWAIYSYLVIAWSYGIYYYSSEDIINSSNRALPKLVDGLYFSVITITTIGYGDYTPRPSSVAQLVVMSEPLVGILLLSFYFAVLVSATADTFRRSIGDSK